MLPRGGMHGDALKAWSFELAGNNVEQVVWQR